MKKRPDRKKKPRLSALEEQHRLEWIRLRERADLTQEECGALVLMSTRAVKDYEQGWRRVRPGLLKLLRLELAARGLGPREPLVELLRIGRQYRSTKAKPK